MRELSRTYSDRRGVCAGPLCYASLSPKHKVPFSLIADIDKSALDHLFQSLSLALLKPEIKVTPDLLRWLQDNIQKPFSVQTCPLVFASCSEHRMA